MTDSNKAATEIRLSILEMAHRAGASHIGSALSCVDLLAVLYGRGFMDSADRSGNAKSTLIFSKGHAAMAQYATLAYFGFIGVDQLSSYGSNETLLSGHVSHYVSEHIPLSTGSLGHGLPYALGISLSNQMKGLSSRTYVLMSDGEMDEGTTWESALIANQFKLSNLVVLIDRNRIQSMDETEKVMALEPLADKWRAFNWKVVTINGHSHEEIEQALLENSGPLCIIANTIKGSGISFMENKVLWHYRPPNDEEFKLGTIELKNLLL